MKGGSSSLNGILLFHLKIGLLSMHTLWMRQHNHIVTELRRLNPYWTGDTLFQEGRKILGAQLQHITYNHWLPVILGPEGMKQVGSYKGYDASINAAISNVFATSAFRFGHTMINPELQRLDATLKPIPEGHLPLRQAFFAPWRIVEEGGIDPVLRGLIATPAKRNAPHQVMNAELTESLFGTAHAIALDLGAVNVQRGRDHGLPSYADWRRWCGLSEGPIVSWDDYAVDIRDASVRLRLAAVYGHPENVDLWVGGLLEDSVDNGKVGRTVRCILVEQFKRLRDGDRYTILLDKNHVTIGLLFVSARLLGIPKQTHTQGLNRT